MAISPVLLVCKSWSKLATRSPALWKRIDLCLAGSEDGILRQVKYVESVMRYSDPALLDINIQFPTARDLWEAFKSTKFVHPGHKCHEWDIYRDEQRYSSHMDLDYPSFHEWYKDVFLDSDSYGIGGRNYAAVVLFGRIDTAIYEFMATITGTDGQGLLRVRSLTIVHNEAMFSTWSDDALLNHPTPLLEELVLVNYGSSTCYNVLSHKAPKLSRIACSHGSSIDELVSDGQLDVLHYRLSIHALDGFPSANMTQNLTTLHLFFSSIDCKRLPNDSKDESNMLFDWDMVFRRNNSGYRLGKRRKDFVFPHLDRLILEGAWPSNLFEAPNLRFLTLLDESSVASFIDHISTHSSSQSLSPSSLHVASSIKRLPNFRESVDRFLTIPSLTEFAFIDEERDQVESCMSLSWTLNGDRSLKGYVVDLQRLFIDFSYRYELEEVGWAPILKITDTS